DDHVASGGPKQMANDERGHHHIIERTKDGNELGDEVDGRGDPGRTEEEEGFGASRHARITDQTLEQPEDVRQKNRYLSGGSASPYEEQSGDGQYVNTGDDRERDQ